MLDSVENRLNSGGKLSGCVSKVCARPIGTGPFLELLLLVRLCLLSSTEPFLPEIFENGPEDDFFVGEVAGLCLSKVSRFSGLWSEESGVEDDFLELLDFLDDLPKKFIGIPSDGLVWNAGLVNDGIAVLRPCLAGAPKLFLLPKVWIATAAACRWRWNLIGQDMLFSSSNHINMGSFLFYTSVDFVLATKHGM
jgi:hypothetical protein